MAAETLDSTRSAPVFIIVVSLLQILSFCLDPCQNGVEALPRCDSLLVFSSDAGGELWRLLTYSLVHHRLGHLVINISTQIILAIPLEMIHGSGRVAVIYLTGVVTGALPYLSVPFYDDGGKIYIIIGASAACYGLIAAHLADCVKNFYCLPMPKLRFLSMTCLGRYPHLPGSLTSTPFLENSSTRQTQFRINLHHSSSFQSASISTWPR